ncbi:MAG: tetratricopeptide repeat protein [Candidatus Brocadiales bacterium]|nr:tetratricopeptide repeat protein [Candidatus Brocadiales bacterium]
MSRIKIKLLSTITSKMLKWLEFDQSYIKEHHRQNIKTQWASFKKFMLPAIMDLYLILVLAVTQVILLFFNFDIFCLSMILLLIVFLLMQQGQKNYYTPHFNPCWAPISILAAKTVYDIWPNLLNNLFYGWAIIAFLCYESIKLVRIILKSFLNREKDLFGYLDPLFGRVFRLSESVGEFIQQNSNKNEKLFVWGDQPSIYLYARRKIFNIYYLIIYAHKGKVYVEDELLNSLRKKPPELLIFYNCKVIDGWNIKRLQESIGIPYDHMKSFKITDDRHKKPDNPQGICFNFPLYRRNDKIYREILIDRSINADVNKDLNQAREHLKKALEISPECIEASLRLSILNGVDSEKMQQSYIESSIEGTNDLTKNSILLRLLSEINTDKGNFDNAMENLEMALALNPDDFRIYNALGELYFSMGKIEDAAKSFNRAVGLNAYSVDAYNNIGVILSQEGKHANAIKCFNKALSIMPDHKDTLKNMKNLTSM